MARSIAALLETGYRVIITHGNGPQVGNLAIQQEEGARLVPVQPLFALGAMTQGQLGSVLEVALVNLRTYRPVPVVAVVTHVVVDAGDPAFRHPTKPIGPFFEEQQALRLASERRWEVADDAGRGHRRVVPSPDPVAIVEADALRALIDAGFVVIAAGGGGIPVVRQGGNLVGVDAVIDKDLAAERLASGVGAEALILITEVDQVAVNHGTPHERPIEETSVDEAEAYLAGGQFPAGSMGPKVTAAVRFIRAGGKLAVITSPDHLIAAVEGRHGTRIVPSARRDEPWSGLRAGSAVGTPSALGRRRRPRS